MHACRCLCKRLWTVCSTSGVNLDLCGNDIRSRARESNIKAYITIRNDPWWPVRTCIALQSLCELVGYAWLQTELICHGHTCIVQFVRCGLLVAAAVYSVWLRLQHSGHAPSSQLVGEMLFSVEIHCFDFHYIGRWNWNCILFGEIAVRMRRMWRWTQNICDICLVFLAFTRWIYNWAQNSVREA